MRWIARVLAAVVVLAAGMGNAQQAPPRLALVIGNADYNLDGSINTPNQTADSAGYPRDLQKPLNDAADVTAALRRLHFDVTTLNNATRPQMIAALAQLGRRRPPPAATPLSWSITPATPCRWMGSTC